MIVANYSVRVVRFAFLVMLSLIFGCANGTNEEGVTARGGKATVFVDRGKGLPPAPASQKLLYRAAVTSGLHIEDEMESLLLQYQEVLLGNLFLEHYMNSRLVVTMDEIREHYVANRSAYQRKNDQVRVLHFLLPSVDDATSVKVSLLEYDAAVRSSLLRAHGVVPTTISPGDMPASLNAILFGSSRPRGVLGPINTHFGFHVLEVLEFFPKASFRGLDEVYDEISQSIYRSKRRAVYTQLLDSLSNVYPNVTTQTTKGG
tara:strand:+ start:41803 stop:42582 length:780 start_codon:yes stop_codon:yes gene_type:complete